MARASRNPLESAPPLMWRVLEAAKQKQGISMAFPQGKNFAVNVRHRFHQFRKEMLRQQHPEAAHLLDVVCSMKDRPDGVTELTWVYLDLGGSVEAKEAQVQADASVQLPQEFILPTQPVDGEKAVEAWLTGKPVASEAMSTPSSPGTPTQPPDPSTCEHVPDPSGTFCTKCAEPL